uniref:VTT domain-containing protein n=1 Tax=Vaginimicrobium propionicum TaxID=1871034 RepID=UPI0009711F46|nr:VTT domain-containing protein [Vaginimicrobium propionicum]
MTTLWGIEFLSALAFGLAASLVPVFNPEAFIVATLATELIDPLSLGLGLGLGQGIGKAVLFQLVRQGKKLVVVKPPTPSETPRGKWRRRWQKLVEKSESALTNKRLGPVIIFSAGAISLPPNYVTTLIAGGLKVKFSIFSIAMTVGFVARNLVEALLVAQIIDLF